MNQTRKPLRIGMIGLGKMGLIRAREIQKNADAVWVCGADPAPPCADQYPGVQIYNDPAAVIESDVDAIFVCTPNHVSAQSVIAALDAGKHVFCEKPPGRTVAEVEAMIAAEQRNPGLKLKFGFNHRYHAGIMEARRIMNSGKLGRLLWMRGIYGKAGYPGFEQSWRSDPAMAGGGILLDQGIHMLDLFRYFCGDFVEFKSMVTTAHWPIEVEDNAFALMRDAHGRIAMIHSSSTQWKHRFNFELFFSDGYLIVNGILSSTRSYGDETILVARKQFDDGFAMGKPREEVIYFDTDPSWQLEVGEFVDCVLNDQPVREGTSTDALKVMNMVHEIYNADPTFTRPAVESPSDLGEQKIEK
ncbi:Gfo/Idh/MocA family oxidoreductase [bacterium]|nr:Gfo/Idh/MocA family oxidoreductase [bacterium]